MRATAAVLAMVLVGGCGGEEPGAGAPDAGAVDPDAGRVFTPAKIEVAKVSWSELYGCAGGPGMPTRPECRYTMRVDLKNVGDMGAEWRIAVSCATYNWKTRASEGGRQFSTATYGIHGLGTAFVVTDLDTALIFCGACTGVVWLRQDGTVDWKTGPAFNMQTR